MRTAPPIVTAETQTAIALTGDDLKIVFTIAGDVPEVSPMNITWQFTATRGDGVTRDLDDSIDEQFQFSADKLTLTIRDVSLLDDGVYTVRAANPAGSDSDYTRLTVYGEEIGCVCWMVRMGRSRSEEVRKHHVCC